MQLIKFLVSISWTRIAAVIVTGLVCGAANTYLVTLINAVVSPTPHPRATVEQFLLTIAVVLISGLLSQVMLIRLAQDAIFRLRSDLSSSVVAAPLEHLERLGMHRLVATLTEDVRSLSQAVTAIPAICIDVATIIGCFVYLATVSGPIFAITIAGTLIGVACVEVFLGRVRRIYHAARENEDALLRSFQAVTLGIKELKLHRGRRRDFMDRHLLGTAGQLRAQNVDAGSKFSVAQSLGQLLQLGTMALILFGVAKAMEMPREVMVGYILVTTFLAMPMQNFMHRIPDLLRGDVALAKIRAMNFSLETLHDEDQLPYAQRPAVESARLELSGVSYHYREDVPSAMPPGPPGPHGHPGGGHPPLPPPGHGGGPRQGAPDVNGKRKVSHAGMDGKPVPLGPPPGGPPGEDGGFTLGPLDLVFEPGEITFVVGGNGSGKSTLAKLITGLYVPRTGTVSINGEAIDHQNIEWFRQNSSAIFTDFHLFEDYLGFDQPGIDDEVRRYLRELRLDDKVDVRDGTLTTIALSQGQRKRLALLTALLEDRPIYVFDEWAADQEPKFREVFYKEILVGLKRRGKTVVVITHDDRYFDCADRLVKLEFGRMVEPVAVES
ncbi:ATP-binding cassette domain-containing protein [Nocardia shimofusensis]|uniref:ATP-binding cassette domain-containing protein n=1 Tax=Nocardia shimofusensis TaxID=228596 RepID=UPI00082CD01C|nr:ATP-binding cassette domain-containing protein [Nocardia shimofusensis]